MPPRGAGGWLGSTELGASMEIPGLAGHLALCCGSFPCLCVLYLTVAPRAVEVSFPLF